MWPGVGHVFIVLRPESDIIKMRKQYEKKSKKSAAQLINCKPKTKNVAAFAKRISKKTKSKNATDN